MNKIYKLILIFLVFTLIGCFSPHYVNIERKHNYYQRHRINTYTSPIWIPGRGVVLETRIYRLPKRSYNHRTPRRKH